MTMSGAAKSGRASAAESVVQTPVRDPLTGLSDRPALLQRLQELLAKSYEDGLHHTLCYLDLDHFKTVNENAGRSAGDYFLQQISRFLLSRIPGGDLLVRLDGDAFGLLLEHCMADKAWHFAIGLCRDLQQLDLHYAGYHFSPGMSIGVARVTAASPAVEEILQSAALACQRAKALGGNQVYLEMGQPSRGCHRQVPQASVTRLPKKHS
jgi:diguanylate cyclase (GGDEF)-like protein